MNCQLGARLTLVRAIKGERLGLVEGDGQRNISLGDFLHAPGIFFLLIREKLIHGATLSLSPSPALPLFRSRSVCESRCVYRLFCMVY